MNVKVILNNAGENKQVCGTLNGLVETKVGLVLVVDGKGYLTTERDAVETAPKIKEFDGGIIPYLFSVRSEAELDIIRQN